MGRPADDDGQGDKPDHGTMTRSSSPPDAYARALSLLGRREHSRRELKQKLAARGAEVDEIDQALERLDERGFQSDFRFAEMLVRSRIAQGYGPIRVLTELRQHGLSEDLARRAIDAEAPDWLILASALCRRRFASRSADYAERVKRANFLARRGFPADIARAAAGMSTGGDDS